MKEFEVSVGIAPRILNIGTHGVSGQLHVRVALGSGKEPLGAHRIGSCIDPRAGLNTGVKET